MEEIKQPVIAAKRLWHIIRIVFFMVKRGLLKRKFTVDFHFMLQRGKLAGKAIGSLLLHHYSGLSCRADGVDVIPFAPRDYEYSCSSTPAYRFPSFHQNKPKRYRKHNYHHQNHHSLIYPEYSGDEFVATAFRKAFEVLNSGYSSGGASATPLSRGAYALSPMVSPYPLVRITDSPFPLTDENEDDHRIDKEAEEFITRFYDQQRSQDRMARREARFYEMLARGTW